MDHQRFTDLTADSKDRVQTGHRFLEDNRNRVAADLVHLIFGQLGQIFAVKMNLAAFNITIVIQQLQNAHCRDTFAGAGLADDAKHLTAVNRIADIIDRLDDTAFGLKKCL